MPNFDVPLIGQQNSKCCWLAGYQMLYGWQKRPTSEPAKRAQKANISTQDALYSTKWCKARDAMGLTSIRVSHLTESWENLEEALERHGPMWCAGDFLQGSPHVIVISGYDDSGKLRINDPYEIYLYHQYSYLTWKGWRKLVKNLAFAVQCWNY